MAEEPVVPNPNIGIRIGTNLYHTECAPATEHPERKQIALPRGDVCAVCFSVFPDPKGTWKPSAEPKVERRPRAGTLPTKDVVNPLSPPGMPTPAHVPSRSSR